MTIRAILPMAIAALLSAQVAVADLYPDAAGEALGGHAHIDILSVEVMNNATDIMFTINLGGDPIATDWGKYLVGIDSAPGGDTASNGWGRPISMSSGMDYFIGSWVDWGDGAEVYSYDGAAWTLTHATYNAPSDIQLPSKTTSSVTLTTTLASLGLSVNDTLTFDVYTTGGGGSDSAVDALSDPNQSIADWPGPFDTTAALSYTVVPEPATLAMIFVGIGAIAARRLRRR